MARPPIEALSLLEAPRAPKSCNANTKRSCGASDVSRQAVSMIFFKCQERVATVVGYQTARNSAVSR